MQIIYLKTKTPISIGDKIKIDNVTITITQQFIDDNKYMFEVLDETRYWKCIINTSNFTRDKIYKLNDNKSIKDIFAFIDNTGVGNGWDSSNTEFFSPSTEQAYLLQIAKEKYPVGTRFRDLLNNTVIISNGEGWYNSGDYWIFGQNTNGIFYHNGQWAEVLTPILITEDGKELYYGDKYWFCGINVDNWDNLSMINYKAYNGRCVKNMIFSNKCKFFSTKEACQEYIDKHKEKTLDDYEFEFSMQYNNSDVAKFVAEDFIQEMKNLYPELYWYKIALLIRDDLNGDWKADWNTSRVNKYVVTKRRDKLDTDDNTITQISKFYFKSSEARNKFINLMGDKINYLF